MMELLHCLVVLCDSMNFRSANKGMVAAERMSTISFNISLWTLVEVKLFNSHTVISSHASLY